jgi:NAD/NADP transhydrogenase beta subunit
LVLLEETKNLLAELLKRRNSKEVTLSDTAVLMTYANKVMIVHGYGYEQ